MISHRQILNNIGQAVCNSTSVRNACVSSFGKGLDVIIAAYAQAIPEEGEAPYLWIYPVEENEEVASDNGLTVHFALGCVVENSDGERMVGTTVVQRTDSANGLRINGANKSVEDLRDVIIGVVKDALVGAIVSKIRISENDLSHFPLEWAEFEVDYTEPEAL